MKVLFMNKYEVNNFYTEYVPNLFLWSPPVLCELSFGYLAIPKNNVQIFSSEQIGDSIHVVLSFAINN
jgi:hypothetical protein